MDDKDLTARLAAWDEIVSRDGRDPDVEARRRVASALVEKGEALAEVDRREEALVCFEDVTDRCGDDDALRESVAAAWGLRSRQLERLGRREEAVVVADEVLARFGDASEPEVRSRLAGAMLTKAAALLGLGRHDDAQATADWVIAHFSGDPIQGPKRADVLALGLLLKAAALNAGEQPEVALAVLDQAIERLGDPKSAAQQRALIGALGRKAGILRKRGATEPALEILDDILARFGDGSEERIVGQLAGVSLTRAVILHDAGRADEAVAALDDVLARVATTPVAPDPSSNAMNLKVLYLCEARRAGAALAAWEAFIARFGDDRSERVARWVADATWRTSVCLLDAGDRGQALTVSSDLVARFAGSVDPRVRVLVATSMYNRGIILRQLGQTDAAIAALEEVYERYDADPPAAAPFVAVNARLAEASYLIKESRADDAITICDELTSRLIDADTTSAQAKYIEAVDITCQALAVELRFPEMLDLQQTILERFRDSADPEIRRETAHTLRGVVWSLVNLGQVEQAITTSDELLDDFRTETDEETVKVFGEELLRCTHLLLHHKRVGNNISNALIKISTTLLQTVRHAGGLLPDDLVSAGAPPRHWTLSTPNLIAAVLPDGLTRAVETERQRAGKVLQITTELTHRLRGSPEPQLAPMTAEALLDRVAALVALGHWTQASATMSDLLSQGHAAADALQNRSERARTGSRTGPVNAQAGFLFVKAVALAQGSSKSDAIQAYDTFINQFRHNKSLHAQSLVWLARGFRQRT
jgi:tetratricopeptide (TPR) repeat protein